MFLGTIVVKIVNVSILSRTCVVNAVNVTHVMILLECIPVRGPLQMGFSFIRPAGTKCEGMQILDDKAVGHIYSVGQLNIGFGGSGLIYL